MENSESESRSPFAVQKMADYFSAVSYDDLPKSVIRHAKTLILDTIGTALGAASGDWGGQIVGAGGTMAGSGRSTILATGKRTGMVAAALTNGTLAHALDFDDTYFAAVIHPSCCVVPAALAAAEECGASGRELIAGAVAGYEVLLRVSHAGLNNFFKDDFHTTGLLGPLGAAAAAARTLRFAPGPMASALGIAAGLGGGILQTMIEGNNVKSLQAGYAAHGGVLATLLASAGVSGPREIFEGRLGLYQTYLGEDRHDISALTDGLGELWRTDRIAIKMYPGAHRHHFFVESARNLVAAHGLNPTDIAEIRCHTSAQHHFYNFTPAGYRPPNSHAARFSVPFLIAAALRNGQVGPDTFSEAAIRDTELLGLAERVTYEVRDGAEAPEGRGHVRIFMKDGTSHENIQSYIRGLPEYPASEEDIWLKFRDNARGVLAEVSIRDLYRRIMELEYLDDIGDLFAPLRQRRES